MSANNWTICPKCNNKILELEKEISENYGKISELEYSRLKSTLKRDTVTKNTLREDYEIGIHKGEFEMSYGCSCSKCGFEYYYDYSEEVKIT
jgi:hypothetical protein